MTSLGEPFTTPFWLLGLHKCWYERPHSAKDRQMAATAAGRCAAAFYDREAMRLKK